MTRALMLAGLMFAAPAWASERPDYLLEEPQSSPWEAPKPQLPPLPSAQDPLSQVDWNLVGLGNGLILGGQIGMTGASVLSIGGYIMSVVAVGTQDETLYNWGLATQTAGTVTLLAGACSYAMGVPLGVAGMGPLASKGTKGVTWAGVGLGVGGAAAIVAGFSWDSLSPNNISPDLDVTIPTVLIITGALSLAFGGYLLEPGARNVRRVWRGRPWRGRKRSQVSLAVLPTGFAGTF